MNGSGVNVYPGTAAGLDTVHTYDGTRALARGHGSVDSLAAGDVNGDGFADAAFGTAQDRAASPRARSRCSTAAGAA